METVQIDGRTLPRPVEDVEQDLLVLITDEYYSDNPDEVLVNLLVDMVLLCREHADLTRRVAVPSYQSLGATARERERMKRKMTRWVARLQRLPLRERHTLQAAIARLH